MNKLLLPLLLLASFFTSSCSDDDDPKIPSNATTVNLMNEDNGKTTIGGSDVYINSANNFTSHSCGIIDLGRKGGFNKNPDLSQIAQQVAVAPGNYYQIVLAREIKEVAEQRAYPIDANFYNVHVDSWIYDGDKEISGAKVSYAESYPKSSKLPKWDAEIKLTLKDDNNDYVETASYSFDKGVMIDGNYDIKDLAFTGLDKRIDITIDRNKINFQNHSWSPGSKIKVTVLVRHESVYSKANFIIDNEQ